MTPRLASLSDAALAEPHSRNGEGVKSGEIDQDVKSKIGIPGRFLIGDLIRARANPSIQGVVLGKTKGREALRVLLAPYASASIPIASVIIDIPAAIIPPQAAPILFAFWNPIAVQNYVLYLAKKGPIKREQETLLIAWVNTKNPADSVFSATSELSIAEVASPGLVRTRINECESTAVRAADVEVVIPVDSPPTNDRRADLTMHTRSSDVAEITPSKSTTMAPTASVESALQTQLQLFSTETKQQLKELTELVGGLARRQKAVEDKIAESASLNATQWEELDLRLNAVARQTEEPTGQARPRDLQATQNVDDNEPDWLLRSHRRDENDRQVNNRGMRALTESLEEIIECPFPMQSRRNDSFRVQRAHRRAHRRLLEDIYGSNDSAVAAAHQLLGQLDKDVRNPIWEAAVLLQIAKGLDIILLEHEEGMWSQWNQPIVDFLARFYFEMVARVRPEEDVVQLMQPDLQKKLRELNFGKQRMYGPVASTTRQSKNWRSNYQTEPSKTFQRDSGSFQKKNQWAGSDKGGETGAQGEQGAWMWHPGGGAGKSSSSFRSEPPPPPPPPQ